jgi:hypothetical protein
MVGRKDLFAGTVCRFMAVAAKAEVRIDEKGVMADD